MSRQLKAFIITFGALLTMAGCSTKVPDLTGKTRAEAEALLAEAELQLGAVEQGAGDGAPGTVIEQQPRAGEKAPDDGTVSIVVMTGDAPVDPADPSVPPAMVAVPDLSGKTVEEATPLLTDAGLVLGERTATIHDGAPGLIFLQNPYATAEVEAGTVVNVTVSADVLVTVPPVVGLPQADAERMLTEAHLVVGAIEPRVDVTTSPVGSVVDANPFPAARVASGTPVKLVVRQPSTTVPDVETLDVNTAQLRIFQRGLVPVVQYVLNKAKAGTVVTQSPAKGVVVARESNVLIRIGRASRVRHDAMYYRVLPDGAMRALTGPEMTILVTP